MLWGYPAVADGSATITPWGQIGGAIIMFFVLGFIPTFIVARILKALNVLRIPHEVELAGLGYFEEETMASDGQAIVDAEMAEAN